MSVDIQPLAEPAPSTRTALAASTHSCPSCGTNLVVNIGDMEEAARAIRELEAQMELLRKQAAAAGTFTSRT